MPSNKYRILSTKPLSAAQVQQAAAHGIAIEQQAFIEVRPLRSKEVKEAFEQESVFVFTSPNAVRIVAEQAAPPPVHRIYCLPGATREAVEKHFSHARIAGTAADSKALAAFIRQDSSITSVVFFCGNIRRNDLPDALRHHHIQVKEIIVYQTLETPVKLEGTYDGILFYSPSSVSSFFSVNTPPAHTVCFAIGHTTGAVLRKATGNKVMISPQPAVDALLQTVILYFDNINSQK